MEMCNRHRNVDCLGSFLLHSLRLWQEWEAVHNPKKLGARTEQAVRSHLHGTTLRPPPIFVGDKAGAESTVAAKLKAWLSSEDGRWWKEQRSALFVSKAAASDDELAEHAADLAEHLELSESACARLVGGAQGALAAVLPNSGGGQKPELSSLRTVSTAPGGKATTVAGLGKRSASICPALTIEAAYKDGLPRTQSAFPCWKDPVSGEDAINRTATVQVEGLLCGVFSNLQIKDRSLSVREVPRKDAHIKEKELTEDKDEIEELERGGSRPSLFHTDTLGNFNGFSNRALLKEKIEAGVSSTSLDHGQTGTVYALEAGDDKIAVFKPVDGEKFSRKSLDAGSGAVREEAVYLVDRMCGSKAGVPVSSRATIKVGEDVMEGSVQAFMMEVQGFIEDYAMPRDLERAHAFVAQENAEALALLDMRVFNMDRHPGNLLLLKEEHPREGP
ncbi:unnamed protein product [Durusdinium trenchii]|uniref:Uncharacterized protein n=2 Tax=Durusdinium trenchii TaxID=1381693 RepID=A0ABP0QJK5_9DINO